MNDTTMLAKYYLREFYLEWVNCWLTPMAMADHHGISPSLCLAMIDAGRKLYEDECDE
jgi:hypothetical protein